MSNSDAGGDKRREPQDPPATLPPMDDSPGAGELREMLRKLGDQIAATDRQHSETLAEMQARLSQIGLPTESNNPSSPVDDHPHQPVKEPDTWAPIHRTSATAESRPSRPYGMDPLDEPPLLSTPDAPQQPMFISSSSPQPWVLKSALGRAPTPHAADTFGDSDPWDRESAESLTRVYESGEGLRASGNDYRPSAPPRRGSEASPADTSSSRLSSDADRSRLEDRFLQIALRIEQSMADMRPGAAIADLSPKFEHLEKRITAALDTLATRADVDGLRHVEAQVNELFTHVEHATAQLARLDGIELQLNALGDRLGDERITRLATELIPTEAELTAFAEVAADRAVARATVNSGAAQAAAAGEDKTAAVEALLRSFIDERRRNEEQTGTILETLQQAMQYMLDRVQVIEQVALHGASSLDSHGAMPADAADMTGEILPTPSPMSTPVAPPSTAHAAAHASDLMSIAPQPPLPDQVPDSPAVTATSWDMLPSRPDELVADSPTNTDERAHGGQQIDSAAQPVTAEVAAPLSRDDYIAAARRAARKASGQPVREPLAAPTPPAPDASDSSEGGVVANARLKLGLKPRILVAASVGILLLAGTALVSASSFRPMAIFARSERPALPADTSAAPVEGKGASATPTAAPTRSAFASVPTFEGGSSALSSPVVSASNPGSIGITVQTESSGLTLEQLTEVQRRQQIAAMSQRMAKAQAEETARSAAALPTVLTSASIAAPSSDAPTPAAPAPSAAQALPLPSALVGPLSLRLAASKGDPSAQFEVAARFAEGRGIKQDFKEALVWYQRSAAQSFAPAQYRLGALYERGLGVPADPARAIVWYKRAAEGGYVKAMHNLAALSADRKGAAPDYATAAQWFTAAARHGLADSQYNLGILAESGLGLERDVVAAYKWLSLAAKQGDKDAAKRRDALKIQLSLAQVRAAEQQVDAWTGEPVDATINDDRRAGEAWKTRADARG